MLTHACFAVPIDLLLFGTLLCGHKESLVAGCDGRFQHVQLQRSELSFPKKMAIIGAVTLVRLDKQQELETRCNHLHVKRLMWFAMAVSFEGLFTPECWPNVFRGTDAVSDMMIARR